MYFSAFFVCFGVVLMVNWASSLMHEPEDVMLLSIYNSDNYLDFPDTAGKGKDPPELLQPVLGGRLANARD